MLTTANLQPKKGTGCPVPSWLECLVNGPLLVPDFDGTARRYQTQTGRGPHATVCTADSVQFIDVIYKPFSGLSFAACLDSRGRLFRHVLAVQLFFGFGAGCFFGLIRALLRACNHGINLVDKFAIGASGPAEIVRDSLKCGAVGVGVFRGSHK